MTARIKIRRDSAASWTSNNPILAAGELGLDTDANQIKVGNGTAVWTALPFVTSSGSSGFDGASNLVFDTENIGFYSLALPTNPQNAKYMATTADSSASNTIADTIYVVGQFYDGMEDKDVSFVTKRNPDNSEAWTREYYNTPGWNLQLYSIIWDAPTDKLYVAGNTYDGSFWKAVLLELDTTNGDILGQTKYTAPDGNYPFVSDLLVDPADGSPVLVGQVLDTPLKVHITPVSDGGVPQGESTQGQTLDPDYSLLVFAKTDFDSTGYYPERNDGNDWALFDQQQPTNNNGTSIGRLNQIRWLEPQTDTGVGSGVQVHLTYSITKNKWISAEHAGWTNGATYGYQVGDKVRVLGSQLGGSDGTDDVVLTVRYVYDTNWAHQIEFVPLEQQQNIATPTAAITNYVRAWVWSYYDFAANVNDGTVWDFGHYEYNSGFVLTNNFQKVFGRGAYNDRVVSADIYNDGTDSFLYVGSYNNTYQTEYNGKRAGIHKLNLTDGAEQWSYTIDRISDGTEDGDRIQSVNCDSQGNIYVVATGSDGNGAWGLVVTKLNPGGGIIWQSYQDIGQGSWDNDPKGDVDLNDDTLYVAGDFGPNFRLMSINSTTGLVTWARDINFVNRYQLNSTNSDNQNVAVGRGRLSIVGQSWDWDSLYNNGNQFGVMFALDANLISFSEVEDGTFGIFKLSVSDYHLVSNGTGSPNEIAASDHFKDSTTITAVGDSDAAILTTVNIAQAPVAITRSPYSIQNVQSITFADGTVQSTAGGGVKHKWKNPNNNEWKIVEWNGGKAVNFNSYNGYSSFYSFTARTGGDQIDSIQINQINSSPEFQAWDSLQKDNAKFYNSYTGQEYRINGWSTNQEGYITFNLEILPGQTLPTYSQGDQLEFRYNDPQTIERVMWFDPSDSPWGMDNFRGAVIKYHAYSDNGSGTFIGEIKYAYDYTSNNEEATHSEQWSGNNDLSMMIFWEQYDGRLYYKNTVVETDYVLIQWTATMFYGNEANC